MARFMIKASEFKNVCKAVNDRKLAELKKEIIEILKKQDEKEVKKAIDYFNSQELHYTHLEKSFTGKWIEKAGYGIGTVRIWKGKKYKKIAPGKWARVFEKEGRGTNIAIGKLIARVQKIDNVEDLMAFVMQNKQRFVDENGVDLPVLDKLRAAVDARNGNVGSKEETTPMSADKVKEIHNKIEENRKKGKKVTPYEAQKQIDDEKLMDKVRKINEEAKKKAEKPAETSKQTDYYKDISEVLTKDEKRRINEKVEEYSKENEWSIPAADMKKFVKDWQSALKETDKHAKAEKLYEIYSKLEDVNWHDENKKLLAGNFEYFNDKYFKDMYGEEPDEKPAEKPTKKTFKQEMNELYDAQDKAWEGFESGSEIKSTPENSKKFYDKVKKFVDDNNIKLSKKHHDEIEEMNGHSFNEALALAGAYGEDAKKKELARNKEYSQQYKGLVLDLSMIDEFKESEAEKHQNRSDAMKGNKNAYKGRVEDIQLKNGARLTTRDGNNYGFAKVSDDRKTSIFTEVKQDKRDGSFKVDYYTADANGRIKYDAGEEGLETDFEDMKSLEEGLNKFFERNPKTENEKSSKEIKSKADKTVQKIEKPLNNDIAEKTVSYNELKPIATNKSVGENEVQMPYSKDLADEIESLKNCVAPKWENREFMKHVYYDDGNLVTTDGRRLKIVRVGKLDGIQDGTYVDITTDKSGINIKKREGMEDYKFPPYKKVMPDNLSQNVTLDSKLVKEKIKAMQKDGAINKKGANIVQLEFRDGKVFIDDTAVGDAKDIQLKTSSEGWGDPKEDTNYVYFNADYLINALSGKTAILQMGEDNRKAMAINTGSTSNVLMPMNGSNEKMDYSSNRTAKAAVNEAKDKEKADNRKYNESKIKEYSPKNVNINIDDMKNKMSKMSDEELKRNYDMLTFNLDKVMDKKKFTYGSIKVDSKLGLDLAHAVAYKAIVEKYPEVKDIVSSELESRGISVKKSLFDDFVMDMFIDEDEEEIEEDEENESLFNDYSAEQPELFNSTEFLVREALNRRYNCM